MLELGDSSPASAGPAVISVSSPTSPRDRLDSSSSSAVSHKRRESAPHHHSSNSGHRDRHAATLVSPRSGRSSSTAADDVDLARRALLEAQAADEPQPPPQPTTLSPAALAISPRRDSAPSASLAPPPALTSAASVPTLVVSGAATATAAAPASAAGRGRPMLAKTSGVKELFQKPQLAKNAIQIKAPEAKDVYICGWLFKSRQKRWFILQGKTLFWFKLEQAMASSDELRTKAQNTLFIHRQRISAVDTDEGAKAFPIIIAPEGESDKSYELVAPSRYLQTQWCDALQMALRVKPTPEELALDDGTKKASGLGNFKRKLFGRRTESEYDATRGRDIGVVMAVEHTGHAAYDAKKGGFDTRGLPPQLQRLFDAVEQALARMGASGISADESRELLKMAAKDPSLLLQLNAEEEAAAAQADTDGGDGGDDGAAAAVAEAAAREEEERQAAAAAAVAEAKRLKAEAKEKKRQEKEAARQRKKLADLQERERKRKEKAFLMMTSIASGEEKARAEADAAAKAAEEEAAAAAAAAAEEEEEEEEDSESSEPLPVAPVVVETKADESAGGGVARGGLLAEIRSGATLRKVEPNTKPKPAPANGGIGFMLASALLERRKAMEQTPAAGASPTSATNDDWD
jgi:hypothetical protein